MENKNKCPICGHVLRSDNTGWKVCYECDWDSNSDTPTSSNNKYTATSPTTPKSE